MKLCKTSNIETVRNCQDYFGFDLCSALWAKRVTKFEANFEQFTILDLPILAVLFVHVYGTVFTVLLFAYSSLSYF